jgi:hypothetical protein
MAAQSLTLSDYSRYRGTPVYQDAASGQLFFGPWQPIDFPPASDDTWEEVNGDKGLRLDLISSKKYGRPDLWWVIARANDLSNPFTQLYGYASYARSPLIFAPDGRQCFYATSKNIGANYNVGNSLGLTFKTTATTLRIFLDGVLAKNESYINLSPYPLDEEGKYNPHFWGNLPSGLLNIIWTATDVLQPNISGIEGPQPVSTSSYLTGGVDERTIYLRLPSLSNVMSALDNAAA